MLRSLRVLKALVPVALGVAGAATACSATNGSGNDFSTGGSSATGGSSGVGGSLSGGGTGGLFLDGGGATGGGLGDGSVCSAETHTGKLAPLDMYVMLDVSSSMLEQVGSGSNSPTKWDAIKQAFTNFLGSSQAAGLGVGIQYFPILQPNVPASCTTSTQCPGTTGPCAFLTACLNELQFNQVIPCTTSSDCPTGRDRCVQLGTCSLDSTGLCYPLGNAGGSCGNCALQGWCGNEDSCQVGDYSKPAVPIGTLPGAASAITQSLSATKINIHALTPTGPALQGAITYAEAWAKAHPSHKVIDVLATDGVPTECPTPTDQASYNQLINQIAGYAKQGVANGIDTFAIGVFSPSDIQNGAQTDLNTIAKQGLPGGTGQAIVVNTSQNVTQEFTDALNKIRGSALSCSFQIPQPQDGGTLDYNKVNVQYTDASGNPVQIYYVGDQSKCDPTSGGWYYDVNPANGGTPTKIVVCGASCTTYQTTANATVNIALGCKTQIRPPS